jgi:hypothetical protein
VSEASEGGSEASEVGAARRTSGACAERVRSVCGACAERVRSVCGAERSKEIEIEIEIE